MGLCRYVYMYVCTYVCMYVGMYVFTYVCMYVCMYVCTTYIRMYVCLLNLLCNHWRYILMCLTYSYICNYNQSLKVVITNLVITLKISLNSQCKNVIALFDTRICRGGDFHNEFLNEKCFLVSFSSF